MTDTERESEIAVWQSDGCFAAKGRADALMRQRDDLVRGRSAEQVARMEQERGLA